MTKEQPGERLFRAWSDSAPPVFDEEAGRARFLETFAAERPRARRRVLVFIAAAAAMACAAGGVALVEWRTLSTVSFMTSTGEGQAGAWLSTSRASELPLAFSEGTQLVMAPGSRGRVEELGREGASFLLERGEVRARVVHRSSTSWRFLAGPFELTTAHRGQNRSRLIPAHHRYPTARPHPQESRRVRPATHRVVPGPEGATDHHGQLRNSSAGHRSHHLGPVLGYTSRFVLSTHHEPGDVL